MTASTVTLNPGTGGALPLVDTLTTVDGSAAPTSAIAEMVKIGTGAAGTFNTASATNPIPVSMVPGSASRTYINLWAVAAAAGATTVETAITLTRSGSPGATTTTGTSFTPTSGKRFRITSITFGSRGNTTATAQATTFTLRVNTAGAVVTSSAATFAARTATPATASAWDRVSIPLPADGIEILGDGTVQFGVTGNATFTTNAPTWDVAITGFEY